MKFSPHKILIVVFLFLQIVLFICLNTNLNSLGDPYRREERRAALMNWGNTHTPESEAELRYEIKLLGKHLNKQACVMASVFLIIDGIALYCFWRYSVKSAPPHALKSSVARF